MTIRKQHHTLRSAAGHWGLAVLAAALAIAGCGGGGSGTTPLPDPPVGNISGQITFQGTLPILPQGDGSRGSTRIIDPQDIIASTGTVKLAADGTFAITNVRVSTVPLYLQLRFDTSLLLDRSGAAMTPVTLNIPVMVADGGTTQINAHIQPGEVAGETIGLMVALDYQGSEGTRKSDVLVNFTDDTVSADLNGDGFFSDDIAPDSNNDSIGDDRNGFDSNPGAYLEREQTGAITQLTNDSVTINGVVFRITGSTTIFDGDTKAPLKLSDFNIGDIAEAEGYQLPGSTDVAAKKLKSEDRLDDDDPVNPTPGNREVEREGFLLARTANTVTVQDITFQVNASTLIVIKDTGAPIALADIPIGGCLDAKGNLTASGIIATRLRYDTTCDDGELGFEVEVEGRITAVTADAITVGGKTYTVIPPIEVENKDTGAMIPYSSLKIDDFVKVKGTQIGEVLRATYIRLDPSSDDSPGGGGGGGTEIEREGLCQARTSTTITVLNTTFTVNSSTEIVIKDTDQPIAFSSIQVGEDVDVRGIQNGTSLIANRIRVDRN